MARELCRTTLTACGAQLEDALRAALQRAATLPAQHFASFALAAHKNGPPQAAPQPGLGSSLTSLRARAKPQQPRVAPRLFSFLSNRPVFWESGSQKVTCLGWKSLEQETPLTEYVWNCPKSDCMSFWRFRSEVSSRRKRCYK